MFRFLSCLALFVLLLMYSCKPKNKEKEDDVIYTVTIGLQIDTSITKDYVAQIKSLKNIEIRAQEKGFLQKIYVDE